MQINLRKANAIQAEIRKAISSTEAKDTISVSEFSADVQSEVSTAEVDFINAVSRKEALTVALFNIRKSVSVANAANGVGAILGDIERIDATIKLLEGVANTRTRMLSVEEVSKRIEKIRNTPADQIRYGNDSVSTGVVSKVTIESAKARIKAFRKARQELQDKLLTVNVTATIEVSDEDTKLLGEEGIL